jgi:hypothetical protein
LGNTLLIFKNANLVGVWISLEVSVIFMRDKFSGYVGGSAPRGCTEDEGRPLGVGLQEQAPKHLKLLWSKAMVVSVEEKVPPDGISCYSERRAQANHPMRCRKHKDDVKTGGYLYTRISPEVTCLLSGRRPA